MPHEKRGIYYFFDVIINGKGTLIKDLLITRNQIKELLSHPALNQEAVCVVRRILVCMKWAWLESVIT